MYEKIEECPSCKRTELIPHLIVSDHLVSQETFAISKCSNCGLLTTNPRPSNSELGKYYESNQYLSHHSTSISPIALTYNLIRKISIQRKLKWISKYHQKPTSILDFGCGTGTFINYCKTKGWAITAVEPDDDARKIAEQNTNQQLHSSLTELKKTETFDVITAWHVLEHVPNLKEVVKSLKSKLNKKGQLFLALPNHQSYDAKLYKELWAGYDVPRHLNHFDQKSIKSLSKKEKLKVKEIIPMKFDAFYVALLSEKYSKSKFQIINALKRGFQSNKSAKKTGEYSSLVYVIEHE